MPITRTGPVHNMDTEEPLQMRAPTQRFTRSQAHRILKQNKIAHDHGAPMEQLLYLMGMHNITPVILPPGHIGERPKLTVVKTDWPNNVPKLRALCKEKKIMFKLTDKKVDLIKKLNDYMNGLR